MSSLETSTREWDDSADENVDNNASGQSSNVLGPHGHGELNEAGKELLSGSAWMCQSCVEPNATLTTKCCG